MNILFVFSIDDCQNLFKPLPNQESIQLGISYVASLLKSYGHSVDLMVLSKKTKKEVIDKSIKKFIPSLICFTAISTEYNFISKVAKYLKRKYPSIYLLGGGQHISLSPEEAIKDSFDALCIGEGEYPTLELVQQLEQKKEPTGIKNLWVKRRDKIEKNPPREFNQKWDELPHPERDFWQKYINFTHTRHPVLIGRGCPFQCTYCCNHALKKLAPGKYVRFRSPESIIKEIKEILIKFPKTNEIFFEIESINANIKNTMNLCNKLERLNEGREKKIKFGTNLRVVPNTDYEDLFRAFKRANFKQINVGLESGSSRIREKILRRNYSNEDFIKTLKLAKKYNIKAYVNIMVGFPEEGPEDFRETVKCCRECQPEWVFPYIFFPYPKTDLYRYCKEKGFLDSNIDVRGERKKAVLNIPGFSKKKIQQQFNWSCYNIYKGYKPTHILLIITLFRIISSNDKLLSAYRKVVSNPLIKKIESQMINVIRKS